MNESAPTWLCPFYQGQPKLRCVGKMDRAASILKKWLWPQFSGSHLWFSLLQEMFMRQAKKAPEGIAIVEEGKKVRKTLRILWAAVVAFAGLHEVSRVHWKHHLFTSILFSLQRERTMICAPLFPFLKTEPHISYFGRDYCRLCIAERRQSLLE